MSIGVAAVRTGIRVECLTVAWMIVEAAVSIAAGLAAGSIALIALGVDSVIELVSAATVLWRLRLEASGTASPEQVERAERRASRVVGTALLFLAVYVVAQSGYNLRTHAVSQPSILGIAIAAAAAGIMPALVRTKLRVAAEIDSPALRGDAACGTV